MNKTRNANTISRESRSAVDANMDTHFEAFVEDEYSFSSRLDEIKTERKNIERELSAINKNIRSSRSGSIQRRGQDTSPISAWENNRTKLLKNLSELEDEQRREKDRRQRVHAAKIEELSRGDLFMGYTFMKVAKSILPLSAYERVMSAAHADYAASRQAILDDLKK